MFPVGLLQGYDICENQMTFNFTASSEVVDMNISTASKRM